ncbi:Xanthine dehydrogenase/oxidase, partial [Armadillidium vulgare]
RKELDFAIVNAAFKISFDFPSLKINDFIIALGSIKNTTIMATKTMESLKGRTWNKKIFDDAISILIKELKDLTIKTSTFQPDYKIGLAASEELHKQFPDAIPPLNEEEKELVPDDQEKIDPVGRPIPHVSALKQTTGEATYIDDIPSFENELHAALVLSEKALGKIVNIDPSEALKMAGVHHFFCAKDIPPEQNKFGYIVQDEEVFATEEEAIEANSVWEPIKLETGNLEEGFQNSKHVLEGESRTGFQEHFYMETNVHIAVPYDNNELHLIGTTQSPSQTQMVVARTLNLEANRVYFKVKRTGGAFGGKETRIYGIIIPIAFAALRTGRPVRICLNRQDDMIVTGSRNPVLSRWKVGFEDDGKLNALDISYYLNAGYSLDSSDYVRKLIIMQSSSVYEIKNLRAKGQSCKTNLPSSTAFRGFGYPQATFMMENIIVRVAEYLRLNPNQVRERNMYGKSNSFMPYGQEIIDNKIRDCWEQILFSSKFEERKLEIDHYNRNNIYKKRGISAIPLIFGAGIGTPFLHQAGALVMVYTDGSVLLSHGGVELGQGLHTKMLQIASRVLEIPMERIYIAETATDKVPNTIATVASISSDLNGMAEACQIIKDRLQPYKSKMEDKSWNDWVSAAYMDRVSLSATGYFKAPNIIDLDFENPKTATPFMYFIFGSGVSEVEVDCLTGDHKGVGEPPLLTAVTVFLAIREAIKAARKEDMLTIQFDSPATSQRIRMACQDWIVKKL